MINSGNLGKSALSCIDVIISGGDYMIESLKNRIDEFLKSNGSKGEVRIGYGLTESSAATCLTPTGRYKDGSIGIPFPDMYYKIVRPGTYEELPVEAPKTAFEKMEMLANGMIDAEAYHARKNR